MGIDSNRHDISTEPSPGPEEHDNLGAEDNKGTPPTVPPTDRDSTEDDDVAAEDPDDEE